MLFTIAYSLLLFLAVSASPLPNDGPKVITLHEGKPRLSFSQRQIDTGASLDQLLQADKAVVLAKYAHNNQMAKVSFRSMMERM